MNISKKNKNIETSIVLLIYLIFLIFGAISFKDYGISVDEWELRFLGFVNLKYIQEILQLNSLDTVDQIKFIPDFHDFKAGFTHGVIFSLPMAFIEYVFAITDSQIYYWMRHYCNHLIFLISNFYFFLIIKKNYNDWKIGIIGALFLFLSPRIFAESFYNHKDILFLSLFIINLYYGLAFLKKPSLKNSLLFSLTTALSIDLRIMGIIIVPIIIFFSYLKYLRNKDLKILKAVGIYLILFPIITILFWPFLWENPLVNFIYAFKNLGSYAWEGYNLYLGKYFEASNLPWHYVFIWILITTPVFYIILFFYGFVNFGYRFSKRIIKIENQNSLDDFWRSEAELNDLIFNILFWLPIFIVIFLNSTLYNGWRHLYFVYPLFLLIAIRGLYLIKLNFFKKKLSYLYLIISIFLIHIVFNMIKDHPYQNTYFNFLAGKNIEQNFELDYWGLSNKQALEYILKKDDQQKINIGSATPISLTNSIMILSQKNRNRINISENNKADYIIDNYTNWHGKYKKKQYIIPDNFIINNEIIVSGKKIVSIYKKIN